MSYGLIGVPFSPMVNKRYKINYSVMLGVLIVALSSALVFLTVLASKMRLSGDDYCYDAILSEEGFWGMQIRSFLEISTYNGNRFSQTLFSGLAGMLPIWGNGLLVISSLIAWIVGLTKLIRWVTKHLHIRLTVFESFMVAEGYACLLFWSTQKLDQSVLWRTAMIAYFLPIVAFTWLLLLIVWTVKDEALKWWKYGVIYISAFITAGFSETGAAVQGGFLGVAMVIIINYLIKDKKCIQKFFFPILFSILGVLTAVALMYFSPVTAIRRSTLPKPISGKELFILLMLNIKVYVWQAMMRRTFMVVLPIIFGLGLGLTYILNRQVKNSQVKKGLFWNQGILLLFLLSLVSIFLIACVMLPSTYVQVDYPPERALILSQSILNLVCIIGGIFIIWFIDLLSDLNRVKSLWLKQVLRGAGLIMIFCVLVSSILLIDQNLHKLQFYTKWSRFWDVRHEELLAAAQKNVKEIHVIQLDHVIDDVGELSPNPDYWYNNCAEMYYGISKIYADQPGW